MKFKIVRSRFLEAIKSVQNIVPSKGSLPVLQNVLIEAESGKIRLSTTDLDITINTEAECDVVDAGASTLPVKYLFNMLSKAEECEVEVTIDRNEKAEIKAGSANYKLTGIREADFPRLPKGEDEYGYKIEQKILKEMLRKVSYAASQDDTRRTLKGVLLSFKDEKLTMVATDGRRLALVEHELEFPKDYEKDIVLPSKTVTELQRNLGENEIVEIVVNKTQICFKLEKSVIYSKLIDEVYPNYKQVIPNDALEQIIIDRVSLLNALERASVMTMDEAQSIRLVFENSKLTISSAASDIGEAKDEVEIKYAGEKIEIVFNPSYIMDPLKAIDDDEITFNLKNGHSPALIKCSIPFLYVLMPLRVDH